MTSKKLIGIVTLGVIFFVLFIFQSKQTDFKQLKISNTTIEVEIVDTPSARTQGLSGRGSMLSDRGMFFVFEKDDVYGIWMKDMRFGLDIIWIDSDFKIVHIEEDVLPETYPKVFHPDAQSLYVLEVNRGFVKEHTIKIGDVAKFVKN